MPIKPVRPRLPRYDEAKPFANVCKSFARLDKVEIVYRHKIQAVNSGALTEYIERMTDNSALFESCWRRNANPSTTDEVVMGMAEVGSDQAHRRLPHQFKLRQHDNEMVSGWKEIRTTINNRYPSTVRDMEMGFSVNFQRFWQNNGDAISYPVRLRNSRREVDAPDGFNLRNLFTLQPDNFPHTSDTFNMDTNLLDGHRWHDTADVPALFSKQLLFLRDYVEAQFPLRGNVTHAQLQRRAVEHEITRHQSIRILPERLLAQVGGVAPLFNWGDFYLPHIEAAFDYKCTDAIQIVQDLMMRALGVGFSASAGFYNISLHRELNIPTVNINLTKSVTLAIYAKAMDRLRIEVRYKGSIHSIFRRGLNEDSTIPDIVEAVIADAKKRTTKLLKELPAPSVEPLRRTQRMAEFVQHVSDAFGNDPASIRHFINTLSVIGSFSQPNVTDTTPYTHLAAHGILQTSRPALRNARTQYSVAPEYAWIVETLRARYFEGD